MAASFGGNVLFLNKPIHSEALNSRTRRMVQGGRKELAGHAKTRGNSQEWEEMRPIFANSD